MCERGRRSTLLVTTKAETIDKLLASNTAANFRCGEWPSRWGNRNHTGIATNARNARGEARDEASRLQGITSRRTDLCTAPVGQGGPSRRC